MADPTPEEQAEIDEAAEWADAAADVFPNYEPETTTDTTTETTTETTTVNPEDDNEHTTSTTTTESTTTAPGNSEDQEHNAKPGQGDDAGKAGEGASGDDEEGGEARGGVSEAEADAIAARRAQREDAANVASLREEIRSKMFADRPTAIKDADGDEIKSIDDLVGKRLDPATGEPFTAEAAGSWLLARQQALNSQIESTNREVQAVLDTQMELTDEADLAMYKYGELLTAMPELKKQAWESFERTLVRDPKSNLITKMPISLMAHYDQLLKPYVDLADRLEQQDAEAAKKQETEAEAEKKRQEQEAKDKAKRKRNDRSDIYGDRSTDVMDDEEKEWSDAMTSVFGPRK